ncbi:MAG: 2-amino-4-hydroxy-6-hydroxymethyldihydropteridine diphosphokinase [Sneathiella sp.]
MILVGLGANLLHPVYGDPINSLKAAVNELTKLGLTITHQSSWYRTAPVPVSDQPWFVNAVLAVQTHLDVSDLLSLLHSVERQFGRVRDVRWEARVLDLDLLAYGNLISTNQDQIAGDVVPHPHMHERIFVLAPLAEICPDWEHPRLKCTAADLLSEFEGEQGFEVVEKDNIFLKME